LDFNKKNILLYIVIKYIYILYYNTIQSYTNGG